MRRRATCPRRTARTHVLGEGTTANKLRGVRFAAMSEVRPGEPHGPERARGRHRHVIQWPCSCRATAARDSSYGRRRPVCAETRSTPAGTVQEQTLVEDLHPETTLPTYGSRPAGDIGQLGRRPTPTRRRSAGRPTASRSTGRAASTGR